MLGNDDLPDQSQPDGRQPSAAEGEARPACAYRDQFGQGQPEGRPLALEDEAQASNSQAASGHTSQEGNELDGTHDAILQRTAARLQKTKLVDTNIKSTLAKASDDSAAGQPHQQARDTRLLEQSQPPAGSGHPEQDPGVTPQAASSPSSQEGEETDNTVCSVSTQPEGRRPHKPRQLPASRLTQRAFR